MDLIIDPHTGDRESAEDVLDEIHAVMKKRGYCLIGRDGFFVLAKVDQAGFGNKARAIAEVKQITPDMIEWRKVNWSQKPGSVQ